ncbi:MAG TPA: NAD(P)/FAD-dependent oxidoreductase [Aestuariivirgaceae bacterium]|nr:NAD(P)/FAD-dependent oxidoreductase [Aestuariivirgaceae bacterium]
MQLPSDPDVVVVGAGAAGIGAGLALSRMKVPHVILEAKHRVGGRAYSDTTSLGHLWDHGCHWFHSADINPLRALAERLGHGFLPAPRPAIARTYVGGKWVNASLREDYVWSELAKIPAAGVDGTDVAAVTVLDRDHPHYPVVRHWVSLMYSHEPEDVSTRDAAAYVDTGINLPVKDGYGALVARLADRLPIALGERATHVSVDARGVIVTTSGGTLAARAAVIAVPQRVVERGGLGFTPRLPAAVENAFHTVPMGWYEKIAFLFDRPVFAEAGLPFLDMFDPVAPTTQPLNFELHPFGRPIAVAHVAGNPAHELATRAAAAADIVDYAVDLLTRGFGSDIRKHVLRHALSGWGCDPDIGGAYAASTKPGHAGDRDRFRDPVHGRVFLAGEHTHASAMATAHGAYLSGIDAARRAAVAAGHPDMGIDPLWLPGREG